MGNQSELTNFNNKLILPKTIIKIFPKIIINNYLNEKYKQYINIIKFINQSKKSTNKNLYSKKKQKNYMTLSILNCINFKTINNIKKQWSINIRIILREILIIKCKCHIVKSIMRENQTIITKHHTPYKNKIVCFLIIMLVKLHQA
ncbi:hypothetical protein BCD_0240 [Borrelia crocidurae DOU]|uniref:Uncharacterized protein n=1 Tax=Borrelia crocidurae DOU TaxID=1293575 RepID=W5SMH1_9SPIR|nr:hypothetical protein BCD_0240 [Borrelia crocidurae DOU]